MLSVKSISSFFLAALALFMFAAVGCENPKADGDGHAAHEHDGHEHDGHGHDHDHPAHGPNGGHIFPMDTDEYQAEWKKYMDNNKIRMYILDAEGKEAAPIAVDSFTVTPKVGEGVEPFELEAEDPKDGMSAVYMLDDARLAIAIPLGVNIEIKMGDKTIKGEIKSHEVRDH